MDTIDTKKDNAASHPVDSSTQFVPVAIVKEVSNSTAAPPNELLHQNGDNEAPVQYRLYKRRWLGLVALVRSLLLRVHELRSLNPLAVHR